MMELECRRVATQRTLDEWRGRLFDWSTGATCAHLARDQMVHMGHKPPKIPKFDSASGAIRALKKRGWDNVADMLDDLLERIPPAMMRVGDIGIVPGQDNLESVLISAGPFKLMGWHPETGQFVVYDKGIGELTGAWRV